ncbi:flocculation protein FLO11-like [Branchiostoma floridae]|uniref:Flocculation protein FLO11-like n=1 Tax=Branchiostoma floridae TaxID=7739 RepID=A0A9J7KLC2_BRAFL|nr:flocculation protein FLO11-like [Branchiostoma floridae]
MPPTGTYLNVILVNETGTETLLCSTSDHLSPWQRIYIGVVQPGPYNIVIEGVPDPPFYPNFGIDDFTLTVVENATAALGVEITDRCSTEIVTTVAMSSSSYNATHPMTISQNTTIHFETSTSSQDMTTITTGSEDTTTRRMTSSHTPILSMTTMTSSHDTTTMPMTTSQDTTVLPMTSKQEETTRIVSNMPTTKATDHFSSTTSQDKTTSGISKSPTSKPSPPEETTKRPIPAKTTKSGEAATKPLPTSTPSKDGQLGQQSGRTGQPDITALPIVLGIAVFLLVAAGAMFYLKKKRKRSSFSVEESRRASRMTLTQTELTEF